MTHLRNEQDRDLHDEQGHHKTTWPGLPSGVMLRQWEHRIKRHLELHKAFDTPSEKP